MFYHYFYYPIEPPRAAIDRNEEKDNVTFLFLYLLFFFLFVLCFYWFHCLFGRPPPQFDLWFGTESYNV